MRRKQKNDAVKNIMVSPGVLNSFPCQNLGMFMSQYDRHQIPLCAIPSVIRGPVLNF